MKPQLLTLVLAAAAGAQLGPSPAFARTEELGCSILVHDFAHDRTEARSPVPLRADSRPRTYKLDTLKVIAQLELHGDGNPYWAYRRAVTLTITDHKDRVRAQLNSRVDTQTGPFEYQTKTTQFHVKLRCEPATAKSVASR